MSELDQLEAELRRMNPAKPPEELMERLGEAWPKSSVALRSVGSSETVRRNWAWHLRWLIPSSAVVVAAILLSSKNISSRIRPSAASVGPALAKSLKADDVVFEEQLLGSFEAVGHLPDGEPVRFRCREWEDGLILRDSGRGIEIERRKPRLEVVRVSYESY